MGQSADKSFAYLLGVYLGDGNVMAGDYFRLNTIDKDFAEAVIRALNDVSERPATLTYKEKPAKDRPCSPQWTVFSGNRALAWQLVEDTDDKQVIPDYVGEWDSERRKQFVIGLMDSEGFVAANHQHRGYEWKATNRSFYMGYKSCDPWVPELARIMESVGLKLGKIGHEPNKPGRKPSMRFHVKMQSWIDSGCRFNIARKQDRVDEWGSVGPYERRARYPRRRLISETNTPDTATL